MTPNPAKWRHHARVALQVYFERHSWPKLTLGAVVAVTGGRAGFAASAIRPPVQRIITPG